MEGSEGSPEPERGLSMDFEGSELYLLHETVLFLDRVAEEKILPPFGITYADCLLLIMIRRHPGSTQQELSRLLNVGKSSLSQRLGNLLSRELVAQEIRPGNRRENSITLSRSGRRLTERCETELSRAGDHIFKGTATQRDAWRARLMVIRNLLAKEVSKD
jgi:DNA-binding MarR family transcriptional regulator